VTAGTCYVKGLNINYACAVIGNDIKITNFLDRTLIAGSTLVFAVTNLTIRNPDNV
jgi:hypothetical protein